MRRIDINCIWNYSKTNEYEINLDFEPAFSHYLKITCKENDYSIKDDIIAPYLSKVFLINDNVTIESTFSIQPGRHHEIIFNKEKLNELLSYFTNLKINFAIIDYNTNTISFENFNNYNNYFCFIDLINSHISENKIKRNLKERIVKIENGYRIVKKDSFVELMDMNDNSIMKICATQHYYDLDKTGRYVLTREEGSYKGYDYISEYTDLVRKINNHFENDIVNINGYDYKILSVKNKQEL